MSADYSITVLTARCPYCGGEIERKLERHKGEPPLGTVTHADPLCFEWTTGRVSEDDLVQAFLAAHAVEAAAALTKLVDPLRELVARGRTYPTTTLKIVMYDAAHLPERSDEGEFADKPHIFATASILAWPVLWPIAWLV